MLACHWLGLLYKKLSSEGIPTNTCTIPHPHLDLLQHPQVSQIIGGLFDIVVMPQHPSLYAKCPWLFLWGLPCSVMTVPGCFAPIWYHNSDGIPFRSILTTLHTLSPPDLRLVLVLLVILMTVISIPPLLPLSPALVTLPPLSQGLFQAPGRF